MTRRWLGWGLLFATAVVASAATDAAVSPGVVFFAPAEPAAALAQLAQIRADGYRLVKLASWCWTLPTPGSALERCATAMLDWCDAHEMQFVLLQNIQFGSAGEGGGLEDAITDPLRAGRFLTDWLRVLRGHRCVTGVILGNEVGPVVGNPREHPRWWAGFVDELRTRHATVAALNAAWGTHFADFAAVQPPDAGSPGQVDLERYATHVFASFYGALFRQLCVPVLGPRLYGAKCSGDPRLQRACADFSAVCWDDVLADYPQWRVKAMGDVAWWTGRRAFNAELHLYHDTYAYGGSPAKSCYRYLLGALDGERLNASFAWGQWAKPATQAIHRATPAVLAELATLAPAVTALQAAEPELYVLLSGPSATDDATAQALYTQVACLGRALRYVCPQDLARLDHGTLLLPAGARLAPEEWRVLAAVPPGVRLLAEAPGTLQDDYGRPLEAGAGAAIQRRLEPAPALADTLTPTVSGPYAERTTVSYLDWSPQRGHFQYPLAYPRLEARRVREGDGWLVAVINHATAGPPVTARLPWLTAELTRVEALPGGPVASPREEQSFAPLAVRLWRYQP